MEDDPFELLGLPRVFEVDPDQVESAYLRRAADLHPDLAAGNPDATVQTARLNQARGVLLDDERRAKVLLRLLGEPAGDALPEGFLMEIMEVRMQIESEGDDPDARARWRGWADGRRDEHMARVAGFFTASDPEGLAAIRMELNAWRYTERLIEQLDPVHRGPDPSKADEPL